MDVRSESGWKNGVDRCRVKEREDFRWMLGGCWVNVDYRLWMHVFFYSQAWGGPRVGDWETLRDRASPSLKGDRQAGRVLGSAGR